MSEGVYEGRLMTDGNGNLMADESVNVGEKRILVYDENGELVTDDSGQAIAITIPVVHYGENHGKPVRAHEGSYVFLAPGEPSHNQVHHQQFAEMTGTQDVDPDAPGYAGTPDDPTEGAEHHWDVTDPADLKFDADIISAQLSGHTAAYTRGSE